MTHFARLYPCVGMYILFFLFLSFPPPLRSSPHAL
ncbi:hypothetical protein OIU74_009699 [Salix koriyanagi]|uniref:Uncharacterized protein n=1 Tax=Salix koriyanagi TaxID=2511006 RepID=A0A9Q0Z0T3_9ROSI|nr:hypothetical protein OIU74_009699 [Salix koriyanagi]